MPRPSQSPELISYTESKQRSITNVLLVDRQPDVRLAIDACLKDTNAQITKVATIKDARKYLAQQPVDLALISMQLPDGNGIDLIREINASSHITQSIILNNSDNYEMAIEALRAGATDILKTPLDFSILASRLKSAVKRQKQNLQKKNRIQKLRKLCKKLNRGKEEASEQVDVLCNDLVTAYQELASQMQQAVQSSGFSSLISDELDLEQIVRKTLEYILEQAGPTNAAIFLPSNADEYTLGGYVNYDSSSQAADLLLEHLADVLAPRVADHQEMIHVEDNIVMRELIGQDAAYLMDSHLIAFPCIFEDEVLAVVAIFRDAQFRYTEDFVENCDAVAPMLGEHLAKVIRAHHRFSPDAFDSDNDQFDLGFPEF